MLSTVPDVCCRRINRLAASSLEIPLVTPSGRRYCAIALGRVRLPLYEAV
jgi:hypothetical protein